MVVGQGPGLARRHRHGLSRTSLTKRAPDLPVLASDSNHQHSTRAILQNGRLCGQLRQVLGTSKVHLYVYTYHEITTTVANPASYHDSKFGMC